MSETDVVIRGLEKMRNESRSIVRAQRIDAAIARIQADDAELAKADRRSAEQERIIAAQREKLEAMREHVATSPFGWHNGHVIVPSSTTDADVIAWLERLEQITGVP